MNKPLLALVAIVALVLVGAGAYLTLSNKTQKPQDSSAASQPKEGTQQSLKDLLTSGIPQKCTFSDKTADSVDMAGTFYITGGKMRGDINTTTAGKTFASHMIVDNNVLYSWIDGQTTGFKMAFNEEEYDSSEANQNVDLNKVIDYSCGPWPVDSSMFSLPTGVSFGEGAMMPATGAYDKCSACNNLPAQSQAQCKAALKC